MIPFPWLTRIFSSFYSFIMPQPRTDDMSIFVDEPQQYSAKALLNLLKNRNDFLLHGLGNIHVERVEYRKSRQPGSPLEHEYLVVTVKESSGADRKGYLLVDRLALNYDPSADVSQLSPDAAAPSSSSPPPPPDDQWETNNRLHRAGAKFKRFSKGDPPGALDRVIVLSSPAGADDVQAHCPYHVLMTMVFGQIHVTLEDFLLLIDTISSNTTQYHLIFAQCYWFAYTIWTVLEMAMPSARVDRTRFAVRQGKLSSVPQHLLPVGRGEGVNEARTPATIKLQWEGAKVVADREWHALRQALRAPELARVEAEQALERERAARLQAEAEVNELRAMLQLQHRPGNVSTNV
ncbi:hypothetical protein F5146DRAFT_446464 [Armillaria mellea]|nr:hypothetical protein F5146DRAFT_446464 [Armillaria mellea]